MEGKGKKKKLVTETSSRRRMDEGRMKLHEKERFVLARNLDKM